MNTKQEKIQNLTDKLNKSICLILSNYKGFKVEEITTLRRTIQQNNGDFVVVKNTLAKISLNNTKYKCMDNDFKDTIACIIGYNNDVNYAKIIKDFIKNKKKGEFVSAFIENNYLDLENTKQYSNLLTKKEYYTQLLYCINSPIQKLMYLIKEIKNDK